MARSFNGTSDDIVANAAASFSEQSAYTVAFWVKAPPNGSSPTSQTCWCEGANASNNQFILIGKRVTGSSQQGIVTIRNNAGGTSQVNAVATNGVLFDSTWHHFMYAQNGAATCGYHYYIDGVLDKSGTYTSGATTINVLSMGCDTRNGGTAQFFNGTLAEVAKWSRQLSVSEAASLAAGLPASHLGPDHYWPLWGVDSPEPDIGAASHVTGSLTGTAFASGGRSNGDLLTLAV